MVKAHGHPMPRAGVSALFSSSSIKRGCVGVQGDPPDEDVHTVTEIGRGRQLHSALWI